MAQKAIPKSAWDVISADSARRAAVLEQAEREAVAARLAEMDAQDRQRIQRRREEATAMRKSRGEQDFRTAILIGRWPVKHRFRSVASAKPCRGLRKSAFGLADHRLFHRWFSPEYPPDGPLWTASGPDARLGAPHAHPSAPRRAAGG